MGKIICGKHGGSPLIETCTHIAAQISAGAVPLGHRLTILGHLFVCDECFNSLGFQSFASLAALPVYEAVKIKDGRWEAFDAAYEAIEGRQCFCLKCVEELLPTTTNS